MSLLLTFIYNIMLIVEVYWKDLGKHAKEITKLLLKSKGI